MLQTQKISKKMTDFLQLKVGGADFVILQSNLERYPETFLARFSKMTHDERMDYCDGYFPSGDHYFFDRSSSMFDAILMLYRVDDVRLPPDVCPELFEKELDYWEIDYGYLTLCSCCSSARGLTTDRTENNPPNGEPAFNNDRTWHAGTKEKVIDKPLFKPSVKQTRMKKESIPLRHSGSLIDSKALQEARKQFDQRLAEHKTDPGLVPDKTKVKKTASSEHEERRHSGTEAMMDSLHLRSSFSRKHSRLDEIKMRQQEIGAAHWLSVVTAMEDSQRANFCTRWRWLVWRELNYFHCGIGRVFEFFSLMFIILTVIVLCVESYPAVRKELCLQGTPLNNDTSTKLIMLNSNATVIADVLEDDVSTELWCTSNILTVLDIIDICCNLWFTLEFSLFLWASPSLKDFLLSAIGIIDVLSILPVYIEYILKFSYPDYFRTGVVVLRFLRCLRVMRILKIARYSRGLMVIGTVFRRSFEELLLVCIYTFILTAFFATLVFYAELGAEGTPFENIPVSAWWSIVTLTTLGYGDMVPSTWVGKIIAAVTTMAGVVLLAFPISIVVERFTTLYAEVVPSKGAGRKPKDSGGKKVIKKEVRKIGKQTRVITKHLSADDALQSSQRK